MKRDLKALIGQMTLEEKASLCSGSDFWHTQGIERLGIPAVIDRLCAIVAPEVERDYARFDRTVEDWEWAVDQLKAVLIDYNWQQLNVDNLCELFDLSPEEREYYFGEIETEQ